MVRAYVLQSVQCALSFDSLSIRGWYCLSYITGQYYNGKDLSRPRCNSSILLHHLDMDRTGIRRTSTRRITSNTNAFGHDIDGRLTHLIQHLFGIWTPHVVHRPRFTGPHHSPPRYGPPSTEQIPWLPIGFRPQNPPLYYGSPSAPYLPPPLFYDSAVFSGLVSRPQRHQLSGGKLIQANATVVRTAAEGMCLHIQFEICSCLLFLVYVFKTFYRVGTTIHEFKVPTNIACHLFERIIRLYLGTRTSGGRIGYRVIRDGSSEELRHLREPSDWQRILLGIRRAAEQSQCEGLEICNVSLALSSQWLENDLL